jgi:DUF4097 and DUF4098 domain-containing protein YvlB
MNEVFQTPGPVLLDLRLPQGDIDVETAATQETVVELTGLPDEELAEVARIEMRERGGTYEIRVEVDERHGFGRFWKSRDLRLEVRAPEASELRVRGGSADVRGRGHFGPVAVDTGSGDVELDLVTADAAVKSGSGDVRVREVLGNASVATGSGDIDIGRAGGDAELRSASGDVHLGEGGHDVTVQTASGDQQIDAVSRGHVTLQSASGDMAVGVRRGSRLAVDARSMSGDTSSEIDLDDFDPGEVGEAGEAAVEEPLVELRATTMSGDIHVARALA